MEPIAAPPVAPRGWDDLTSALRLARARAGSPSFAELVRRVASVRAQRGVPSGERRPGRVTVYDAFRDGRSRLDVELVADLVRALGGSPQDVEGWRRAHASVAEASGGSQNGRRASAETAGDPEDGAVGLASGLVPVGPPLVGRGKELTELARLLAGDGGAPEHPRPTVVVVTGLAGAGKTALAAEAGRRYARATGAEVRRATPAAWSAPRELAESLGQLPPATGPGTAPPLLVVDDPPDTGALRELIDLLPGWLLVVTARRVPDLSGVTVLRTGPLSPEDARILLAAAAGPEGAARLSAEAEDAGALADACGHLPLSLSIAAGQIAARPDWSVADHLHRIAQSGHAVPTLDAAYRALAPDEALLLRRLALHPAELDLHTAATLAGVDEDSAAQALVGLEDEHLVRRTDDGRYAVHDLVRRVVRDAAEQDEPVSARRGAVRRLAERLLDEAAPAIAVFAPHHGVPAPAGPVPEHGAAVRLLDRRREVLIGTAEVGADLGLSDLVGALSGLTAPYLDLRAPAGQAARMHAAAVRVGGPETRAQAGRDLGRAWERLGRFDEALAALVRARESGYDPRPGQTLNRIGNVYKRLGRLDEAARSYREAVTVSRTAGDPVSEGRAEGNLADTRRVLGDPAAARAGYDRALRLSERAGDVLNVAIVTGNLALFLEQSGDLGRAEQMMDRVSDAAAALGDQSLVLRARIQRGRLLADRLDPTGIDLLRDCVREARELGEADAEAESWASLGDALLRADDLDGADAAFGSALTLATRIHAGLVEAQVLAGLGQVALGRAESRSAGSGPSQELIASARESFRQALDRAERDPGETVRALLGLGRCARAEGDLAAAVRHWRRAHELAESAGLRERDRLAALLGG